MNARPLKFRFYLDENFPVPAGKFLKSLGHNVKEVVNCPELRNLTDLAQLKIARKNKRIFIALDKDFATNEELFGVIESGPGVILIGSSDPNPEKVKMILSKVFKKLSVNVISGKILSATIDKTEIQNPQFLKKSRNE